MTPRASPAAPDDSARRDGSTEGQVRSGGEDERYEPTDPHPDTPDDFEDDAIPDRESDEAITEDVDEESDDRAGAPGRPPSGPPFPVRARGC